MDIAKLRIKNVVIRDRLVKKVLGIYVHGIKTEIESPHKFMMELRKERKQEILEAYERAPPGSLYPNIERDLNLQLILVVPKKKRWFGLCPYSTKNDMPFKHG